MTPRELKKKQKSSSSASAKYKKTRIKKEKFKVRRYGKICEGPECKKPRERGLSLLSHSPSNRTKPHKTPTVGREKIITERDVTETKPKPSVTERESDVTTVYGQTVGGSKGSKSREVYEGKASDYKPGDPKKKVGDPEFREPGVSKGRLVKGEKGVGGHTIEKMVVSSGGKTNRITETKKSSVSPTGEKTLISSSVRHTDRDVVKYDAKKDKVTVEKADDKKRKDIKRRVKNRKKPSKRKINKRFKYQ